MFDIGMRYEFTLKDIVEEDTANHVTGIVVEYNHPLVKVEETGGLPKIIILNLASSQFLSAALA